MNPIVKAEEIIPIKDGYYLDFHDEFEGDTLDRTKWTDYYLPHWTSNPQNAKGNIRLEDGKLVEYIDKDQKPWAPELDGTVRSSAIMSFNKNWIHNFSGSSTLKSNQKEWTGYVTTYGYFEIRAKFSNVSGGGHQAWWMVGMQNDTNNWFDSKQTGEIDIIETFFSKPNTWRLATFGWNDPFFQTTNWFIQEEQAPASDLTEQYHTYGLDWSPGSLKFYFDGELYKELNQAPDYPMGTILNIYTDAGSGKANNVYPKEWSIDYFRVYKRKDGYSLPTRSLVNRETSEALYIEQNSDKVLLTTDEKKRQKWKLIPKGEYFIVQNVSTGEYLHIENQKDYLEHGNIPETYWSAQWKIEKFDAYVRFVNRWKPNKVIHIENNLGYVEVEELHQGAWRGQWLIENV